MAKRNVNNAMRRSLTKLRNSTVPIKCKYFFSAFQFPIFCTNNKRTSYILFCKNNTQKNSITQILDTKSRTKRIAEKQTTYKTAKKIIEKAAHENK